MAELLEDIGHNIRRLREQKGWNQTELGFHANASPSIISLIENGKRNPSTTTLAKIACALGVEVADLFPTKVQLPLWRTEGESERQREPENVWQALIEIAENPGFGYALIAGPNSRAAWGTTEKALKDLVAENAGLRYTLIADPNSRAAWDTTEKALKDLVAENTVLRATFAELREELAKVRETA